jgi:hypothetical protein
MRAGKPASPEHLGSAAKIGLAATSASSDLCGRAFEKSEGCKSDLNCSSRIEERAGRSWTARSSRQSAPISKRATAALRFLEQLRCTQARSCSIALESEKRIGPEEASLCLDKRNPS